MGGMVEIRGGGQKFGIKQMERDKNSLKAFRMGEAKPELFCRPSS